MPTTMIQDPAKAKEFFEAKMAFTTGPVELERMMKEGSVNVVDVRAADDYAKGHIPGAVNLPKERWASLQGLRKDRTNVIIVIRSSVISEPLPPWNSLPAGSPLWSWTAGGDGGKTTGFPSKRNRAYPYWRLRDT